MRLILSLTWLLILSAAMLTPGKNFPEVNLFDFQDKFIHLVCFFIQSYLWCGVGIRNNNHKSRQKRLLFNFLGFGILVGLILETTQLIIPNRSFEWIDMVVNLIGGILGFLTYLRWPTIKFILD